MITKKYEAIFKSFFLYSTCLILFYPILVIAKAKPKFISEKNKLFLSCDSFQFSSAAHIKDFGAVGDGVTNNTEAFQKASAYLLANGGTLIIDPGSYVVGKQRLSGSYTAGSAYFAEPILSFIDAKKPIVVLGYKATLKAADGLKFGSFNPITGEKDSIRKVGNNSSYYASAFTFFNVVRCVSITIKGITLDGNSAKLNIGPAFGPDGIQLAALGIGLYSNKSAVVADCYIHNCALDGIIVAWTGLKDGDPIYPHTITNVRAEYNGRQGLSWVGGNNLTVINSDFSSTGKALNYGLPVISKPSAGIDIELENSILKNGNFINCRVFNNAGSGVISIAHDTYNINFKKCTFIGTTNSAAYPRSQNFSFDSCTFVGRVERIFGSVDKSKATSFKDCLFTMDPKMSPNGQVYGDTWEFYEGQNVVFDHCEFDAVNKYLPTFNVPEIEFLDCSFSQNSDKNFNAAAIFKGTTKFIMAGKGKIDATKSVVEGNLIYNNKKIKDLKNPEAH
jgi:hypothetical protein